jgi:PleD family two-component response regulator
LCDYEAFAYENGKLALEALKDENNSFDLVLLDLFMPEMDGFELLSHMQEDDRLREIPVVIMSANNDNTIVSNCLKMGAKDYIVKPIRKLQCQALIKNMKKINGGVETKLSKGLGKYEVIKEIGRGNAGTVSLVRNKETNE